MPPTPLLDRGLSRSAVDRNQGVNKHVDCSPAKVNFGPMLPVVFPDRVLQFPRSAFERPIFRKIVGQTGAGLLLDLDGSLKATGCLATAGRCLPGLTTDSRQRVLLSAVLHLALLQTTGITLPLSSARARRTRFSSKLWELSDIDSPNRIHSESCK